MKKLFIEVEWVGIVSGRLWVLKPHDQSQGLAQVMLSDGRYWNSIGQRLGDGHDTLKAAQKAVEDHFMAQHMEMQVNG